MSIYSDWYNLKRRIHVVEQANAAVLRAELEPLELQKRELEAQILATVPVSEGTKSHRVSDGGTLKTAITVSRKINQTAARELLDDYGVDPILQSPFVTKTKSEIALDLKAWRQLDHETQAELVKRGAVIETVGAPTIDYAPPALDEDGAICTQSPHREAHE